MQEEAVDAAYLREQADRCVRLAKSVSDPEAIAALRNMAMEYQIRARRLDEASHHGVAHPKMEPPPQT